MPAPSLPNGPIPNRSALLIGPLIVFPIFSSIFVCWRSWISTFVRKKWRLSDYFIVVAQICNIISEISSVIGAFHALGRHIYDVAPVEATLALKCIWIAQLTNLMSMFFLKASIASYLIALDFSRRYRVIIWITVVLILLMNLLLPLVAILGTCKPLTLNWDRSVPGRCWPGTVNAASGYAQSVLNVLTDMIYTASPLIYLQKVKLNHRTQWGLRAVFLIGLLATACSITKLTELKALENTEDPTWDGVDLTIMSAAEVNVGIFAACLPPLRLAFEGLMRRLLGPGSSTSRSKMGPLTYEMHRSRTVAEANDYDSERSILAGQEQGGQREGITKTVNVHIHDEAGIHQYAEPFASPRFPQRAVPRQQDRLRTLEIDNERRHSPPGRTQTDAGMGV